jgi:hypothetical protein
MVLGIKFRAWHLLFFRKGPAFLPGQAWTVILLFTLYIARMTRHIKPAPATG